MNIPGQVIGVDESGKGDFFGPLVVASALAGPDQVKQLHDLGVRDSKKITAKRILEIDRELRSLIRYELVVLMPEEYNQRYDRIRNLNILLAECHARAIVTLTEQAVGGGVSVEKAVSDKFGKTDRLESALRKQKCKLPVMQIVRGETVIQVAAASIIARAEFVRRMSQLSEETGIELPKGAAAQVDQAGRKVVARYGPERLKQVAKLHFKNYARSLSPRLL